MIKKMVLTILTLAITFSMVGCVARIEKEKSISLKDEIKKETQKSTEKETEKTTEEATQEPTTAKVGNANPTEHINFYKNDRAVGARIKKDAYTGPFKKAVDIASFDVFTTNEEKLLSGYFKAVWDTYWTGNDFKIGYHISFNTSDGKSFNKNILSPKDTEEMFEYVEVYLYDDTIRARGEWYSHLLEQEMTKTTIMSSIKLHGGAKADMLMDTITLTVFMYKDSNDFDDNTKAFIGECSKKIVISKE